MATYNSSSIVFANGETLELPMIHESGPGWVLKPDELRTDDEIRRGSNKSFGRGSKAWKEADNWLIGKIERFMTLHDWPKPVSHSHKWLYNTSIGGINITFTDPVYGFDQLVATLHKSYYNNNEFTLKLVWNTTRLRKWIINRNIDKPKPFDSVEYVKKDYKYQSRESAAAIIQMFAKDPISTCGKMLGSEMLDFPYDRSDLPPLEWPDEATSTWLDDAETISVYNDLDHMFYRDGAYAKRVYTESWSEFSKLQTAFEHLGIDFRVHTAVDYSSEQRQRYVSGLSIKIPGNRKDEHNQEGHTVEIKETGVAIECGYRQNEEKWEEHMKRQAADWLQEMQAPTTTTYEDYEHKPSN